VITRWCLGVKTENALTGTLKTLNEIIFQVSNSLNLSDLQKAKIRLVCGIQVLKLAQEETFRSHIYTNSFYTISRLIIVSFSNL
jgi:hypothetical protein